MDKHRGISSVFILCMLFIFVLISGAAGPQRLEKEAEEKPSIYEVVRRMFSVQTSAPTSVGYWDKVKALMNQAQAYFFPPNLDFRGTDEAAKDQGEGSGGEKVKEAVAKSIEKGKATVEESAKSAAEIAGQTMQKTKDKVKKTSSHQSEL